MNLISKIKWTIKDYLTQRRLDRQYDRYLKGVKEMEKIVKKKHVGPKPWGVMGKNGVLIYPENGVIIIPKNEL